MTDNDVSENKYIKTSACLNWNFMEPHHLVKGNLFSAYRSIAPLY